MRCGGAALVGSEPMVREPRARPGLRFALSSLRPVSESREVSAEEFRQAMAPTVEALNALAGAVEAALGPRHGGLPDPESDAMKELASEGEYSARSTWKNPITDTHSFGSLTLWAAADYVGSFAATLGAERAPIYGHLALARDALEASVVSFWLNERGIAYDERVKRGLCEVIYSANEVKRLGLTEDADAALTEALEWADAFTWGVSFPRGKPEVDGTKRRSVPEGIRSLLVDDEEAKLGRLLWSRLSAVTHVTWWGLTWALDLPDAPAGGSGFTTVPVGTDSSRVLLQALCILRALRVVATERFALMGWVGDAEWDAARQAAEQHEQALLKALVPGA